MRAVMQQLFRPMLFTTPTTSAGFATLALTLIPPVQVFGVFVAIGVLLAWLWSILFIPAYFMPAGVSRLIHHCITDDDTAVSLAVMGTAGHAAPPVAEPADFITV